jgi:hypothetical protein
MGIVSIDEKYAAFFDEKYIARKCENPGKYRGLCSFSLEPL